MVLKEFIKSFWLIIVLIFIGIYDFIKNETFVSLVGSIMIVIFLIIILISYRKENLGKMFYYCLSVLIIVGSLVSTISIWMKHQPISLALIVNYLFHISILICGILMLLGKMKNVISFIKNKERTKELIMFILIIIGLIILVQNWNFW
jgi:hypothetical protein